MGKRIALVILVITAVSALALPSTAAPARANVAVYAAPFTRTHDVSQCDDGDGTAICTASAALSKSGSIATAATLEPANAVAIGGRAEGRGGPQVFHKLAGEYSAVRYSFVFADVRATTRKEPAAARDIDARVFAAGFVHHTNCAACAVSAAAVIADADLFTPEPPEVASYSVRVEAEMRNPSGKVPKGTTLALGYLLSDVALYDKVPAFTSSAGATASGRLVRIEVWPVP